MPKLTLRYCWLIVALLAVPSTIYAEDVPADVEAKIAAALPAAAPATPATPRHILIYSRTCGFRHASIPTGVKALQLLGERTRAFDAVHSEDPAMFEQQNLNQFDAVVMLNTTGECLNNVDESKDQPSAEGQRRQANLQAFVAGGKGLFGIHAATDTMYGSKIYGDMIGGWFTGHPWHTEVPLKIDAANHPLTCMFNAAEGYVIKDEIYQFAPRGASASFEGYQPYARDKVKVLMSLNTDKFDVKAGARTDNDYAISWIRNYEKGRVFYTVLGHNDFIFWNPDILKHDLAGLQFVLGDLAADAQPQP